MTTETIPAPVAPAAQVPVASESPKPEAQAPVSEPTQAESAEQATSEPKPDTPEQPKQSRASGRIAQLFAEKKAAEADALMHRQEAIRLRDEVAKLRQTPIDQLPFEQQTAATLREQIKVARYEEKVAEAENANERARSARTETFHAKVDAVRERMPDFDQVFGAVPISDVAADLIAESDKAAEVAYWLGKNPADAARIYRLPAHLQGAEIARIEHRVSVPVRKTTQAPPPPPQVGASSAPGSKDPANMSMAEYAEWRGAQMRKR